MAKKTVQGKKSYIKKVGANIYNAAKARYAGKNWGSNIKNIAGDVMMLKNLLNVEKKRHSQSIQGQPLSQVLVNANGAASFDITPIMGQGVTAETRNGASIKVTGMYAMFQFVHQSATSSPIKGCIYIFKILGGRANATATASLPEVWKPNPFITGGSIIDYNSQRNTDYFKEFKLLKKQYFKVACDALTGQQQISNVSIPIKLKNHHVRFDNNSTTVTSGQIFAFILVDNGNAGATASTLTGIANAAPNTGLGYSMNLTSYYVDN